MPEDTTDSLVNEDAAPEKLSDAFPGIHISSLQEQDEQRRAYSASLSPLERMAFMHQLICIAYAEELKRPVEELWNKTIVIEKLKW